MNPTLKSNKHVPYGPPDTKQTDSRNRNSDENAGLGKMTMRINSKSLEIPGFYCLCIESFLLQSLFISCNRFYSNQIIILIKQKLKMFVFNFNFRSVKLETFRVNGA